MHSDQLAGIDTALTGAMLRLSGQLYPADDGTDPGFIVDTDTVNTPESIQARELNARVAFRPAPGADLVTVHLTAVGVADQLVAV